jgi:hypothetical protein
MRICFACWSWAAGAPDGHKGLRRPAARQEHAS